MLLCCVFSGGARGEPQRSGGLLQGHHPEGLPEGRSHSHRLLRAQPLRGSHRRRGRALPQTGREKGPRTPW